jgi:hypothetical protein
MKLREFVDSYDKEFVEPSKKKPTNIKDIPNEGNDENGNPNRGPVKVSKNKCDFCKKQITSKQKWFGDKMGKVYHEECHEKKFGNEDEEKYGSEYPEPDKEEDKLDKTERKKSMAKSKEPKKEVKKPLKKEVKKTETKKKK